MSDSDFRGLLRCLINDFEIGGFGESKEAVYIGVFEVFRAAAGSAGRPEAEVMQTGVFKESDELNVCAGKRFPGTPLWSFT